MQNNTMLSLFISPLSNVDLSSYCPLFSRKLKMDVTSTGPQGTMMVFGCRLDLRSLTLIYMLFVMVEDLQP